MEEEAKIDFELVQRVLGGEISAFREVVDRHRERVIRIAFRISDDFHAAEDIAQDAFLRAYEKLSLFDSRKGAFSSWLYQITKNTAINSRRKRFPAPVAHFKDSIDPRHAPDLSSESRDEMRILDRALEDLKEPFRSSFILAELEQLPLQTIAEIEEVPIGTIKSRISRAKATLRASLKNAYHNQS